MNRPGSFPSFHEEAPQEPDLDIVPDLGGATLSLYRSKENVSADSNQVFEILDPVQLAEEKDRLLKDEVDESSESRYSSGRFVGFMEARPGSIALKSSDSRAQGVIKILDNSPRLTDRYFVDKRELLNKTDESRVIKIERTPGDPSVELPLSNFVSAELFESWSEGRVNGISKKEEGDSDNTKYSSRDRIDNYASRATEIPPIESVVGLVQPNGLTVYIVAQGSHRTAAAIKRGDLSIKTDNLILAPLEINYFEIEQNERPTRTSDSRDSGRHRLS
jgi:hypothetical protein